MGWGNSMLKKTLYRRPKSSTFFHNNFHHSILVKRKPQKKAVTLIFFTQTPELLSDNTIVRDTSSLDGKSSGMKSAH